MFFGVNLRCTRRSGCVHRILDRGAKPLVCTPRGGKRATAPHTLFAPVHNAHLVKCKLYIGYFSHTHYPSTTVQ